jgi:hypothetical protein
VKSPDQTLQMTAAGGLVPPMSGLNEETVRECLKELLWVMR